MLDIHGPTSMSEFFGEFVIYRRLEPCDERLPGLPELWERLGWPAYRIPRKTEQSYAQVVAEILRAARRLDAPHAALRRVVYIGDTRMNDGTAFTNLCRAGGWDGQAFIGAERPAEPARCVIEGQFFVANRWGALGDFAAHLRRMGFPLDHETVAVIDMDKTTVGARGRNDRPIDEARVQAVHETVADLLGEAFRPAAFRRAYDRLNVPEYHSFTGDNQDVLAYLCLVIGGDVVGLEETLDSVQKGQIASFDAFIHELDMQQDALRTAGLLSIHRDVLTAWEEGDPTPFKAFRYREYETTSARFNPSPAGELESLIEERILITEEVRSVANALRGQGVLVFGLSDKPDEASIPTPKLAAAGRLPLHRCITLSAGEGVWQTDAN